MLRRGLSITFYYLTDVRRSLFHAHSLGFLNGRVVGSQWCSDPTVIADDVTRAAEAIDRRVRRNNLFANR